MNILVTGAKGMAGAALVANLKNIKEGKNQLVIAIGCTGGKHRSVTLANEIYNRLKKSHSVIINHNDIEKDSKIKSL